MESVTFRMPTRMQKRRRSGAVTSPGTSVTPS